MRVTTTYTPSVIITVVWKERTTPELESQFLYRWPTLKQDSHSSTQHCYFTYGVYLSTLVLTDLTLYPLTWAVVLEITAHKDNTVPLVIIRNVRVHILQEFYNIHFQPTPINIMHHLSFSSTQ